MLNACVYVCIYVYECVCSLFLISRKDELSRICDKTEHVASLKTELGTGHVCTPRIQGLTQGLPEYRDLRFAQATQQESTAK